MHLYGEISAEIIIYEQPCNNNQFVTTNQTPTYRTPRQLLRNAREFVPKKTIEENYGISFSENLNTSLFSNVFHLTDYFIVIEHI